MSACKITGIMYTGKHIVLPVLSLSFKTYAKMLQHRAMAVI